MKNGMQDRQYRKVSSPVKKNGRSGSCFLLPFLLGNAVKVINMVQAVPCPGAEKHALGRKAARIDIAGTETNY